MSTIEDERYTVSTDERALDALRAFTCGGA
jgi:hypothetical protein